MHGHFLTTVKLSDAFFLNVDLCCESVRAANMKIKEEIKIRHYAERVAQ